jgi:Peptidase M15
VAVWWVLACSTPVEMPEPRRNGLVASPEEEPADEPEVTSGTPPQVTTTTTPGTVPTTTTPVETPVDPDEACYPGPSGIYDVCLDVAGLEPIPEDYEYPPPLDGSLQYLAPVRFLWLDDVDGGTDLAPNFALSEFADPLDGAYAVVQPHAVASLQLVRDELGPLVVNSGYRSPAHNFSVGGATWSRHMYGDGFDLDPVSATLDELVDSCEANGAGYVGLYETHVHCDWRYDDLDAAFFPTALGASASTPLPELSAGVVEVAGRLTAPATGWDEGEPLRVWRAYDASDVLLDEMVSRQYTAPSGAARVEVVVGGVLTLSRDL